MKHVKQTILSDGSVSYADADTSTYQIDAVRFVGESTTTETFEVSDEDYELLMDGSHILNASGALVPKTP